MGAGSAAAAAASGEAASNAELDGLEAQLRGLVAAGQADGFLLYLLGLVLADREKKEEARQVLAASVAAYPCNWSAWLALQSVCGDMAAAGQLALPDHFAARFFLAHACVDTHHNAEALQHLQVSGPPWAGRCFWLGCVAAESGGQRGAARVGAAAT